jgi:hypothetical protein
MTLAAGASRDEVDLGIDLGIVLSLDLGIDHIERAPLVMSMKDVPPGHQLLDIPQILMS